MMRKIYMIYETELPDDVCEAWEQQGLIIGLSCAVDSPMSFMGYPCYLAGAIVHREDSPAAMACHSLEEYRDQQIRQQGHQFDRRRTA